MNALQPIAQPMFRLLANGDVKCLLCGAVVAKDKVNMPDRCLQRNCPVNGVDHG